MYQGDDGEGGADQQPQPGASQPPPNEAIAAAVAAAKAVSAAQEQAAAGAGGQGVCGAAGAGLGCVGPSEGVATQGGGAPQVPGAAQDPARRASLESTKADDGHAFQPASSPQQPLPVTGVHVVSPWVMRSADDLATPFTNYTNGYKVTGGEGGPETGGVWAHHACPMCVCVGCGLRCVGCGQAGRARASTGRAPWPAPRGMGPWHLCWRR